MIRMFISSLVVMAGMWATAPAVAGTITGKIAFTQKAPPGGPIRMSADPVCVKAHVKPPQKDAVIVNPNGTLKNVFVYIKEGAPKGGKAASPVKFDQNGCIYVPHVFGVMTSQPIEIINSDPTLHNVHSMAKKNENFNMGMATKGQKITKSFSKPEQMIKVKCDVHGWMQAFVGVMDHPYFDVSNDSGTFTLKDVPPGDYVVEVWHEKYNTKSQPVKVAAAGETKTVDFSF